LAIAPKINVLPAPVSVPVIKRPGLCGKLKLSGI
jgi:hypothetical protein